MTLRVDNWIKDLRSQPVNGVREKGMQNSKSGVLGRDDGTIFNIYSRSGGSGKETEGLLPQLLASCRALEGQLRMLQAEQRELRQETLAISRCLDRAGVLPARELEKELEGTGFSQSAGSCRSGRPVANRGTVRDFDAQELPASSTALFRGLASSKKDVDMERSPSPRGGRGRSVDLLHKRVTQSPRMNDRGRSASVGRSAVERVSSRQRLRSVRSPERGQEHAPEVDPVDGEPSSGLYEVLQPLLDSAVGTPEHVRWTRSLQEFLRNNPAPPDSWSGPGTPLNAAVRAGRADVVRALTRSRANPNERDQKGVSPLHLAVFEGSSDMVQMLLTARADIDACDRHGQTPLFFAPSREICKLLMDRRADATLLNRKGQTALHLAGRAGLYEVLACLSTRVSRQVVELGDVNGTTAREYLQQLSAPQQASVQALGRSNAKKVHQLGTGMAHKDQPAAAALRRPAAGRGLAPARHRHSGEFSHQQLAARLGTSARAEAQQQEEENGDHHNVWNDSQHFEWSKAAEHFFISNGSDQERGAPASPDSPVPLEAMYGGLDIHGPAGKEGQLVRAVVGRTALEAAAAVATAAMATAAELEAAEATAAEAAAELVAAEQIVAKEAAAEEAVAEESVVNAEEMEDPRAQEAEVWDKPDEWGKRAEAMEPLSSADELELPVNRRRTLAEELEDAW